RDWSSDVTATSSNPNRALQPSVRAAPMHSPPRWRCCKTPNSRRKRSSASRSPLPAICVSTLTRTTSWKPCRFPTGSLLPPIAMSAANMTPGEIVSELDKHIVGQDRAKRSVAVAMRNRWRRQQVAEPLRNEIVPKNILMIGPTGVGKTEIARRLAKLADAPFIKIEATKFTEVGYVGRDVDTIIRDLVEISVKQTREVEMRRVRTQAEDAAEDRILDVLVSPSRNAQGQPEREENNARQIFRKRLREGRIDDMQIDIEVAQAAPQMEIMAPPGMEEMTEQ